MSNSRLFGNIQETLTVFALNVHVCETKVNVLIPNFVPQISYLLACFDAELQTDSIV